MRFRGDERRDLAAHKENAMTSPSSRWLVTTDWLASKLGSPDVVAVDGSFYLPAQQRDAEAEVQAALKNNPARGVASRPGERFRGEAPGPRPGVRPGHIPGSLSVPSSAFIENGRLLPPDAIRAALEAGGVDLDKPVITSCGSGV